MSESLFIKVAYMKAGNVIKKRFQHMFSSEYCEIFKNTYFEEHPRATASVGVNMIGTLSKNVLL